MNNFMSVNLTAGRKWTNALKDKNYQNTVKKKITWISPMSIKVAEFIVKHLRSKKYQEKMVSLLTSTNMGERWNDNSTGAQLENGKGVCAFQLILWGHHF